MPGHDESTSDRAAGEAIRCLIFEGGLRLARLETIYDEVMKWDES